MEWQVFEAEWKYALQAHIYKHLTGGNRSERAIVHSKRGNRRRSRRISGICIGLPKEERASPPTKKRSVRHRIDPASRKAIIWHMLSARGLSNGLSIQQLQQQWHALRKPLLAARRRVWQGRVVSWEFVEKYRHMYEI